MPTWTEINFMFSAFFQHGIPLYSAKGVRFKLGHWKHSAMSQENDTSMFNTSKESHDDRFWWSYISPIYPMAHVSFVIFFIVHLYD